MTWELSDLLRVIATTIVISIHASHHWWFGVKDTVTLNPEIFIDTIINQVGRFTVPIFVVLSGFALAKSEDKRPFDLKIFANYLRIFNFFSSLNRKFLSICKPTLYLLLLNPLLIYLDRLARIIQHYLRLSNYDPL